MKKPDIPNFKFVVGGGAVVLLLLVVLLVMIVKLNTMEGHLVKIQIPSAPTATLVSSTPSSSEESSMEEVSSEEVSSMEASSKQQASSKKETPSKPQESVQPPVSSGETVAPPVSSENTGEGTPSSGTGESEAVSSVPEAPAREDGITRIELINVSGGKTADLSPDKFDEFLTAYQQVVLEETEEFADPTSPVDVRIRIYQNGKSATYTVYPFWTQGDRVCLELSGGKQFMQYLKTMDVFAGQALAY